MRVGNSEIEVEEFGSWDCATQKSELGALKVEVEELESWS